MRNDILGIVTIEPYMVLASALIIGIGVLMVDKLGRKPLLAAAGWGVTIIGVLALLQSFWFNGFRELNALASVLAVIVLGIALIRNVHGMLATIVGGVVAVFGVIALSEMPLIDDLDFHFDRNLSASFEKGWDRLTDVLSPNDNPVRNRNNR